jgi:hypothetical protein
MQLMYLSWRCGLEPSGARSDYPAVHKALGNLGSRPLGLHRAEMQARSFQLLSRLRIGTLDTTAARNLAPHVGKTYDYWKPV